MKKTITPFSRLKPFFIFLLLFFCILTALLHHESSRDQFPAYDPENVIQIVSSASLPTPAPAAQLKEERNHTWEQIQIILEALQENTLDSDIRQTAESHLLQHARDVQCTLLAEHALESMGFSDSLCIVQNGMITLFIPAASDERSISLIVDLLCETTGAASGSIRIIRQGT